MGRGKHTPSPAPPAPTAHEAELVPHGRSCPSIATVVDAKAVVGGHGGAAQLTAEEEHTLRSLRRVCTVMDSAVRVPGTNATFGLDALIGLVPIAGDALSAAVTAYCIYEARRYHLSRSVLLRMMANQTLDMLVGCVPLLGDIWDVGFKANTRNLHLIEEHLRDPRRAKRSDACFLATLLFVVFVLPLLLIAGTIAAIVLIILAATHNL